MKRFENKVVVITGAAGGIGEATTRRIVSEGGKVVIADHSQERADKLAAELTQAGADVRPIYFSAIELQSCKELVDFAMKEYGQIDVLINNVGGTDPKRDLNIEKLDIDYFDEVFHLNLCCTMYLSQQVIPIMTTHGGGNIVNVASALSLECDGTVAVCPVTMEEIGSFGAVREDLEGFAEQMRRIKGVRVAVLIRQDPGNRCKLSLRSSGSDDVRSVAALFGGGGHLNAAGATIDDADMDAVTRQTIKAIQDITFGAGKEEKR